MVQRVIDGSLYGLELAAAVGRHHRPNRFARRRVRHRGRNRGQGRRRKELSPCWHHEQHVRLSGQASMAFFNAADIATCWRQAQQMAAGFVPARGWDGMGRRHSSGTTWGDFLAILQHGDLFERKHVTL